MDFRRRTGIELRQLPHRFIGLESRVSLASPAGLPAPVPAANRSPTATSVAASAPRLRSVITPLTNPPTSGAASSLTMDNARSVAVGNAMNAAAGGFARSGIVSCGGSNRNPERDGVIVIAPAEGKSRNAARPFSSVTPWRFTAPANCRVTPGSGRKSRRVTLTVTAPFAGSAATTTAPRARRKSCEITLIRTLRTSFSTPKIPLRRNTAMASSWSCETSVMKLSGKQLKRNGPKGHRGWRGVLGRKGLIVFTCGQFMPNRLSNQEFSALHR